MGACLANPGGDKVLKHEAEETHRSRDFKIEKRRSRLPDGGNYFEIGVHRKQTLQWACHLQFFSNSATMTATYSFFGEAPDQQTPVKCDFGRQNYLQIA